ncbi:hypothetical protein [Lysinibacillus sp. NPDC096212]|uniref:hypothetical protein n=1 Tax=Lysinibacillus sp. NPDC096212 TaxID=3364135 RepID=UPI0037F8CC99
MHLSDKQKKIIVKIQEGSIEDIYSFVSTHEKVIEFKYDHEEILKNKTLFLNKRKEASPFGENVDFSEITEALNIPKPLATGEFINQKHFDISIELVSEEYIINPFKNTVLYLPNLYNELLEFYQVWNQLERNQLLLTMEKKITKQDAEIFLKEKIKSEREFNNFITFKDNDFADFQLIKDEESILLSTKYLGKKILPLPDLNILIENKYKTEDRLRYDRATNQSRWALEHL